MIGFKYTKYYKLLFDCIQENCPEELKNTEFLNKVYSNNKVWNIKIKPFILNTYKFSNEFKSKIENIISPLNITDVVILKYIFDNKDILFTKDKILEYVDITSSCSRYEELTKENIKNYIEHKHGFNLRYATLEEDQYQGIDLVDIDTGKTIQIKSVPSFRGVNGGGFIVEKGHTDFINIP